MPLVKCHTGEMPHGEPGRFVHSMQNVLTGRSAARLRVRGDLVPAKRGKRGRVLFCPVPKGQIQRLSEEKLKELVKETLN